MSTRSPSRLSILVFAAHLTGFGLSLLRLPGRLALRAEDRALGLSAVVHS